MGEEVGAVCGGVEFEMMGEWVSLEGMMVNTEEKSLWDDCKAYDVRA